MSDGTESSITAAVVSESKKLGADLTSGYSADSGSGSSTSGDILPGHMSPTDPRRMLLINEEAWWALDIKIAVEQTPELDNLSDFLYAQLAIVCKNNVEDALSRAKTMQNFREEHSLAETFESGSFALKDLLESQPDLLRTLHFDPERSAYSLVVDLAKCNTPTLTSLSGTQKWLSGMYYILHAICPDLESIRKGFKAIIKWEDIDASTAGITTSQEWGQLKYAMALLGSAYPCAGQLLHCHTDSSIAAVVENVWRETLSREFWTRFTMGRTTSEHSSDFWSNASVEGDFASVQFRFEEMLQLRYENITTFSLSRNSYNLQQDSN